MASNSDNNISAFQKIFPMDVNYYQNYIQYYINNVGMIRDWLKMFGVPCTVLKLKKSTQTSVEKITYSQTDKEVLAYGKANISMSEHPENYDSFQTFLPIINETFNKINSQFTEDLQIYTPPDLRFAYSLSDIILFKHNNYLFRFTVSMEPTIYSGILLQLQLKYQNKKLLADKIETNVNKEDNNSGKYW